MAAKETLMQVQENVKKLSKANPEMTAKFMQEFVPVTLKPGVLDAKTKELIAVGLAIAARCEPCIAVHMKKAIDAGMTREELGEVCGVNTMMGGGPAMMYAAKAMAVYDELKGE